VTLNQHEAHKEHEGHKDMLCCSVVEMFFSVAFVAFVFEQR